MDTSSEIEDNTRIEAVWGYGKTINEVQPDVYYINKTNNKVSDTKVARQMWAYYASDFGKLVRQDLPSNKITMQALTTSEIIALSNLARNIEEKFGKGYRIKFGFEKGEPYIFSFERHLEAQESDDGYVENPIVKDETPMEEMQEFDETSMAEDLTQIPPASIEEAKEHIKDIATEESHDMHEHVGQHVAEHLDTVEPVDEQESYTEEPAEEHSYKEALEEVKRKR